LRLLVDRVAGRHVADLVAEHPRHLRFVVQGGPDSPRYIDVAAGPGEGVDGRRVDGRGKPRQGRGLGGYPQLHSRGRHVVLAPGIVVRAHLLADFGVVLLAHRDLAFLADEGELTLAGGGVGRARLRGGERREEYRRDRYVRPYVAS